MKCTNLFLLILLFSPTTTHAGDCINLFGDSLTASLVRDRDGSGLCTADNQRLTSANVSDCVNLGRLNVGGHAPELNRLTNKPVYNYARTNFTAGKMLPTVRQAHLVRRCDLTVILLGTNDAIQGVSLEQTEADLSEIVNLVESENSRAIVVQLPTLIGSDKANFQNRIDDINIVISMNFRFIDITPLEDDWVTLYSSPDNLHLSIKGSDQIAKLVFDSLAVVQQPRVNLTAIISLLLE